MIEMIARTIKNEVRARLRKLRPNDNRISIVTSFLKQSLGENPNHRYRFWLEQGLALFQSRYDISITTEPSSPPDYLQSPSLSSSSSLLLKEILSVPASDVIDRLMFWLSGKKQMINYYNTVEVLSQQMIEAAVHPFPYITFQEGTNWLDLITLPTECRVPIMKTGGLDPKRKAIDVLVYAIGTIASIKPYCIVNFDVANYFLRT